MEARRVSARLSTTPARNHDDVSGFFDASAAHYIEQHGPAARLLRYRVSLLRVAARFRPGDTVLEIGCGDGMHLFAMAGDFARGIGVDISAAMIERANARANERFRFSVDLGETLATVDEASVDVVYCVGSLEHMLDQPAVARAARRVLKPGGRFAGLTPNGGYVWYRHIAPLLGLATQHLATDHFLTRGELVTLLHEAGFTDVRTGWWTFIPRGDMPSWVARILTVLDWLRIPPFRGGIVWSAATNPKS